MSQNRLLRRITCVLLSVFLLSLSVSATAFVIGSAEDLEALSSLPENSEPISSENAAPIATNLEFSTYKNVEITEALSAYDPDGDLITFRITKNPARGAVELAEDGSGTFVYTPYENKTGKDSFTYVAVDSAGNVSAQATVKIKIEKQKTKVTYSDMSGHTAHRAAVRLAELDVMVGQRIGGDYFFKPEETISREEFLSLAMNTLGADVFDEVMTTGFADDDVIATWAKPYVASALYNGTITGSQNEEGNVVFQPGSTITQGEATVLLNRLLQVSDVSSTKIYTEEAAPAWAQQSVMNLQAVGVVHPDLAVSETLTRGEAAVMLSNALDVLDFRAGK